jgi:hypothetical protein
MTIRGALTCLMGMTSVVLAGTACAASGLPDGALALRDRGEAYDMQVLVDGVPVPTFQQNGETYVMGQLGQRYTLRIRNHSPRRIEAVVSVDGRDVVDGKSADYRSKRGYLVPAWGQVDIDGWRLTQWQAAAFRFSAVEDSYAARVGAPRNVGVIGAAIFTERFVPRPPPPVLELPPPYAERQRRDDAGDAMPRAESAPGKKAAGAAPAPVPMAEAAPSSAASGSGGGSYAPAPQPRAGLGTEFGESVSSPIHEVAFIRASASRPTAILGMRYNDRAGLIAMGIDVDRQLCAYGYAGCDPEAALRQSARAFPEVRPVVQRRYAAPPPGWSPGCCDR